MGGQGAQVRATTVSALRVGWRRRFPDAPKGQCRSARREETEDVPLFVGRRDGLDCRRGGEWMDAN